MFTAREIGTGNDGKPRVELKIGDIVLVAELDVQRSVALTVWRKE